MGDKSKENDKKKERKDRGEGKILVIPSRQTDIIK